MKMTRNTIQQNSPLPRDAVAIGARYIRAKELKRVYGVTARALSNIPGAPKAIKLSSRAVLYSIADLDFYFRRNQGGSMRGTSLAKKRSGQKPPLGPSLTANSDTQVIFEKLEK